VQREEAAELLDQLHEVLDERFEAGPAAYVIDTMTAQPAGSDAWAVEVVFEAATGAPKQGLRVREIDGSDGTTARTTLQAAWDIYRRLESGRTSDDEPDENGVRWATL
jgi:hypothetical protein